MTRSQSTAFLWFLGGVAFIVAGLVSEPRRFPDVAVGLLFFIVGMTWLRRGRRNPSAGG